jgi:predicted negative regulator of RcsB-dependent stress response
MSVYSTEEEQIEAIKAWWKQYGTSVIAGLVLGGAIMGGTKYWMSHQNQKAVAASTEYQVLIDALDKDNLDQVLSRGAALVDQYPGTPYAALAALAMAKAKVEQGKFDEAEGHLQWVIDHGNQPELKHIARLRLAKLLLAEDKADAALAQLGGADPDNFQAAYEELKGDIYTHQGKTAQARSAYQAALAAMPEGVDRSNLQMKLDDLGAKDAS